MKQKKKLRRKPYRKNITVRGANQIIIVKMKSEYEE